MAAPPAYAERAPIPPLQNTVACTWTGRLGDDGTPYVDRVLPDGCIDLIWDGSALFVAGPDTGPVPLAAAPGARYTGLRFRPGTAPAALGVPASELLDRRVDAADVIGAAAARELAGWLHEDDGQPAVLEAAVAGWLAARDPGHRPDPLVQGVVRALAAAPTADVGVGRLAADLGVSERQLHRRCTAALGYGPKTFGRIARFRRFLALAEARRQPRSLGQLAASAGYADQAHLARECRRLAGATPSALVSVPFKTGAAHPA
ncbi:MAG: DUF6597 domain-containing transcriptional factor [Acidimicrobiia bacterium]